MAGTINTNLLMLCLVCTLDAGRLPMIVNAQITDATHAADFTSDASSAATTRALDATTHAVDTTSTPTVDATTLTPTVDAMILTPPLDRREGGRVAMICVARNLEADHIVEWAIKDPDDNTKLITLRWGSSTFTTRSRYEYTTMQMNGETIQYFTITNLKGSDANEYICNVNKLISTGGGKLVASDRVTFVVLDINFQFPNDSFPICSPDGPITVDSRTELNMRCSSEGNSTESVIMMEVSQILPPSSSFIWTPSNTADTFAMCLDLTVDVAHDGVSFECVISSVPYPEVRRSCTIGPISVKEQPMTKPNEQPTATVGSTALPWIAAFVVAIVLLAASTVVIIFLVRRVLHLQQLILAGRKTEQTLDPYIELQPTSNQNTDYMEPVIETTPVQHTYYEEVRNQTETPYYDYVGPEGGTMNSEH